MRNSAYYINIFILGSHLIFLSQVKVAILRFYRIFYTTAYGDL